jgi:hypothetical protein
MKKMLLQVSLYHFSIVATIATHNIYIPQVASVVVDIIYGVPCGGQ